MKIVWLKESVLKKIEKCAEKFSPKETGGVLMGYVKDNQYIITELIGPGKKAVHEAASFQPDYDFHNSEVTRIYNSSKSKITYLGDWHTHPNSYPYLSDIDKKALKNIANYKAARISNPLMLILAPPNNDYGIWIFVKESRKFQYSEAEIRIYN